MPILISAYIRPDATSSATPPSPSEQPAGIPALPDVLTTQRGYRFAGFHLFRDGEGNIVYVQKPTAWLTQPRIWSQKATVTAQFDLRSY